MRMVFSCRASFGPLHFSHPHFVIRPARPWGVRMNSIRFKLCAMMFLEFFIWGAWFPLIFGYLPSLGFSADWEQPLILGAFNLAAFAAMFFSTQFADRNFAAEKFLAFSQVVGGAAIMALAWIKK